MISNIRLVPVCNSKNIEEIASTAKFGPFHSFCNFGLKPAGIPNIQLLQVLFSVLSSNPSIGTFDKKVTAFEQVNGLGL